MTRLQEQVGAAVAAVLAMSDRERLDAANAGILDRMFLRPEVIAYYREQLCG